MTLIKLLDSVASHRPGDIVEGEHAFHYTRPWGRSDVYSLSDKYGHHIAHVWVVPDEDPDAEWADEGYHGVLVDDEAKEDQEAEDGTFDPVERPEHYNSHPSGVEAITITRHYIFAVGNAIKYLWRAGLKKDVGLEDIDKEIQDLKKAKWYIEDRITELEGSKHD